MRNERVCRAIGPGNYALGAAAEYSWAPRLIGRSDTDVKAAILALAGRHPEFKMSYALTSEEAFRKECRTYHDFGGTAGELENVAHPAPTAEWSGGCPVAGCTAVLPAALAPLPVRPHAPSYVRAAGQPPPVRFVTRGRSRGEPDFLSAELQPGEEGIPFEAFTFARYLRYAGKTWQVHRLRLISPPQRYVLELSESRPPSGAEVVDWAGPADPSAVSRERRRVPARIKRPF